MTDFRGLIGISKDLANWIGDQIEGLGIKSDNRTRVAGALLSVSLGHHAAIVQLFEMNRHGSALALIRSMIDCLVRAQWVAHLASDEEIDGFVQGNDPPGIQRLVKKLEDDGPLEKGVLSTVLSADRWATVCDFNHGGARMVVRHLKEGEIAPNFTDDELKEAIGAANAWSLISASAMADLARNDELGARLLQKIKELPA